jgi:hypothetical protein
MGHVSDRLLEIYGDDEIAREAIAFFWSLPGRRLVGHLEGLLRRMADVRTGMRDETASPFEKAAVVEGRRLAARMMDSLLELLNETELTEGGADEAADGP